MQIVKTLLFFFLLILCFVKPFAQSIKKVDAHWIEQLKHNKSDTIYIINFWATWCKPCVAELPLFDTLTNLYQSKKVKVILVSNDMKREVDTRLPEFIREHKVTSTVYWMSELNADKWINPINKDWSGAIPATWIVCPKKKLNYFKEGEITQQEIKTIISTYIR